MTSEPLIAFKFLAGFQVEAIFSLDADGKPQLHLKFNPPEGSTANWGIPDALPAFKNSLLGKFRWSNSQFDIDSANPELLPDSFPLSFGFPQNTVEVVNSLKRGMAFQADIVYSGSNAEMIWLLGDKPIHIAGPIEWLDNLPRIDLQSGRLTELQIDPFNLPVCLHIVSLLMETYPDEKPAMQLLSVPLGIINGILGLPQAAPSLAIPFYIEIYSDQPGLITIVSNFEGTRSLMLEEAAALLGIDSLASQQPKIFPLLQGLELQNMIFVMNSTSRCLASASINVKFEPAGGSWKPFNGDLFSFKGFLITFTAFYPFSSKSLETSIECLVDLAGGTLDSWIKLPDMDFGCELKDGTAHPIDITKILNEITDGAFTQATPNFKLLCTELSVFGNTNDNIYRFRATLQDNWEFDFLGAKFALSSIAVDLTRQSGQQASTSGQLVAEIMIANVTLHISADYGGSGMGWLFRGGTDGDQNVSLDELIGDVANIFGLKLSAKIPKITFSHLQMMLQTSNMDFGFSCDGTIEIMDRKMDIGIELGRTHENSKDANEITTTFHGYIVIAEQTFEADFRSGKENYIDFTWIDPTGFISFAEIISAFGFDADEIDIPEDLDLALKGASFSYNFSAKELILTADSKNYGKSVFVMRISNGKPQFFFSVAFSQTINLTDLPLVKGIVKAEETVAIKDIQVCVASSPFDENTAREVNKLIAQNYPKMPDSGISDLVSLFMLFSAGSYQTPLSLSISGGKKPPKFNVLSDTGYLLSARDIPLADSSDKTVWYDLQKTFGPISFQKVGIRYNNSILYVLINATLGAGGLNISVLGLGVGSALKEFSPKFNIDGIAITFKEGPVDISGGLIGTLYPIDFYGELIIGFPGWNISALGGYAELKDHPSFFLYAVLNRPIGGPSFFFVTGLAAGFGFNRRLMIPDVSQVATFPLVQWAMGSKDAPEMSSKTDIASQVRDALTKLSSSGVVAPSLGEYWLALGIRFTSFKLLDSFILLTVSFGTNVEIDLLGISRLSIPPSTPNPVANVELALKASFSPVDGILSILGQLTSNSYLFSKNCHLTGGFAVCTWLKGQNAGDFVITLGGYGPRFVPPAHYPQVPILGLSWNVNSNLSLKGSLYFALTPKAIMAGGSLNAIYTSGCIMAWFDLRADFLMVFHPFQYYLSASVHFGGSVRLNLLFTTVTLTINLGAGIEIWGPEFSGKAKVDLGIFSFTISFGSGKLREPTVSWDEFKKSLMPAAASPVVSGSRNMRSALSRKTIDNDEKPAIVQILISGGLQKTISEKDDDLNYVVNAEGFELTTQTAIPSKEPDIKPFSENIFLAKQQPDSNPNVNFGVGPTGTDKNDFSSIHSISIRAMSGQKSRFQAIRVLGNAPKALWEKKTFDHGVPVGIDPLNDTTIKNVLVGYKLVPEVFVPDKILPINLEQLLRTIDRYQFEWSLAYYPIEDSLTNEAVLTTIGSPSAIKSRESFLKAISMADLNRPNEIDVNDLQDPSRCYLLASPGLSLLGEQKQKKV